MWRPVERCRSKRLTIRDTMIQVTRVFSAIEEPRWLSNASGYLPARGYPSTTARFWMNNRKCLATRGAAAASLMNTLNRPGLEFTGRFTGAHAGVHAAVPHWRNDCQAFSPGITRSRREGSRAKTGHERMIDLFTGVLDQHVFSFSLIISFHANSHFFLFTLYLYIRFDFPEIFTLFFSFFVSLNFRDIQNL